MENIIETLVNDLVASGVKYAFGITGSGSSLQLISELQKKGVVYYPVGHEGAAIFMAGGCCRDGVNRAVAITIKGPGFINLTPGILSNYYEGRPALTISEAYADKVPLFRTHKRLNHESIVQSVCKAYGISNRKNIIKTLLGQSQQEPPGPVHLDLIGESSLIDNDNPVIIKIEKSIEKDQIDKLEQILQNSNRPCLVLGSFATRLKVDWNTIKVPVITTAAAKGCYDEASEFSAGIITGEVTDLSPESWVLKNSDLIVAIGLRNTEVIKVEPYAVPLIMIDQISCGLQDGFEPTLSIISSELKKVLTIALKVLEDKSWGRGLIVKQKLQIEKELSFDKWLTGKAFDTFQKNMRDDTILVLDTGFFCTVGETVWQAKKSELFCGSSVGRFMGSAIPTAIGVSISVDNPVLCVMGDGGISPYIGEVRLAVSEKLSILFVLMTDGRYGSVAAFSQNDKEIQRAVNVGTDSWCNTMSGLNCKAVRLSSEAELIEVLQDWQNKEGPLFVELPFEPEEYANTARRLR